MIVPQFWAESRLQHREKGRQVTLRRFGWSDTSQADAQSNADVRVRAALDRVLAGAKLPRIEPKIPYNGADGVPIREEIVARHGETIVTRNAHGARCLNTPNVLFSDIDFPDGPPPRLTLAVFAVLALVVGVVAWQINSRATAVVLGVLLVFTSPCAAISSAFGHGSRPRPGVLESTGICGHGQACGRRRRISCRFATRGSRSTSELQVRTPPARLLNHSVAASRVLRCKRFWISTISFAPLPANCLSPEHNPHPHVPQDFSRHPLR